MPMATSPCGDQKESELRSQGELGLKVATSCMALGNASEPQFLLPYNRDNIAYSQDVYLEHRHKKYSISWKSNFSMSSLLPLLIRQNSDGLSLRTVSPSEEHTFRKYVRIIF